VTYEDPKDGYRDLREAAKSLVESIFAPTPSDPGAEAVVRELRAAVQRLAAAGSNENEIRLMLAGAILGKNRG